MFSFVMTVCCEAIIFALYIFVCLTLMKPRFALGARVIAYCAVILCSCGAVTALTLSGNGMAALTLLPLIAYLPFSVCAFILCEAGIFETAAACSIGALAALTVKIFKKILPWLFSRFTISLSGFVIDVAIALSVLAIAAAAAFIVYRYVRKPFGICAGSDTQNRLLIIIPAAAIALMIFINFNSMSSAMTLIISLIIAAAFFVIASRLFYYSARAAEADANEKRLSESLELQRKNFEQLSQNVDAGRLYRHDMRHHLKVLSGMAQQNNSVEILEYIGNLNKNDELCAPEMLCKNPAVNAVVSEYMNRAKNIGCRAEHKIFIPEELPFELPDVCIILSNALDNALNACEKCPEDKRYVDLLADFEDERKLKISVRNSCADIVRLDGDGLPIVAARNDGHGIGLCGVKKTVEKYNGFICCSYENGEFLFCAEIFRAPDNGSQNGENIERKTKRSKALPAVLASFVCTIGMLNFSPMTADALSQILSANIKTISYGWGDNSFNAIYPEFSGENSDKLNQTAEYFIKEARDTFFEYATRKYEGYVAEDAGYRIYINDQVYLSARFYATLNAGGSMDYSRCMILDKQSDKILTLSDLFDEDYDYIGEISAEVLSQMEFRVQYMKANYFIPGGIWSDDECFKEISPDQEFYLNSDGKLVIVFDEYTVAPGSEGSPEFVMPDEIFRYYDH